MEKEEKLKRKLKTENTRIKPGAQAAWQTLPDTASPIGKIHPLGKIAITLEPVMQFLYLFRFIIDLKHHLQPLGRSNAVKKF